MSWSRDERRSARLLFSEELRSGRVTEDDVFVPEVRCAVSAGGRPVKPARMLQRLRMKRGSLTYEQDTIGAFVAARRAVLDADAAAPPRVLIRVDEFPHAMAWDAPAMFGTDQYKRFHATLMEASVPYMIAVPPRVSHHPLDPAETRHRQLDDGELAELQQLQRDGVTFSLHGLDHRTRHANPRQHSELAGLSGDALAELIDTALAELAEAGIRPDIFVPPYNRFDVSQYPILEERFEVVCGGPENVMEHGYRRTPQWRGDAVWLPGYAPFYSHAADVLAAGRRQAESESGVWIPAVLHWGWEAEDGWDGLDRLAREAAAWTASWDAFMAAVRDSAREPATAAAGA